MTIDDELDSSNETDAEYDIFDESDNDLPKNNNNDTEAYDTDCSEDVAANNLLADEVEMDLLNYASKYCKPIDSFHPSDSQCNGSCNE